MQGNKTWSVVPVPECDHVCHKFQYYVEPGDVGGYKKMYMIVPVLQEYMISVS